MGLLDDLFGYEINPAAAHAAALKGLLNTAASPGDSPDPSTNNVVGTWTLRDFLNRRQENAADGPIPPASPYGGQTFGGQTFGGERFNSVDAGPGILQEFLARRRQNAADPAIDPNEDQRISKRALAEFLIRRQQDAADPALPPPDSLGQSMGGNSFGGNTFGGNTFGGGQGGNFPGVQDTNPVRGMLSFLSQPGTGPATQDAFAPDNVQPPNGSGGPSLADIGRFFSSPQGLNGQPAAPSMFAPAAPPASPQAAPSPASSPTANTPAAGIGPWMTTLENAPKGLLGGWADATTVQPAGPQAGPQTLAPTPAPAPGPQDAPQAAPAGPASPPVQAPAAAPAGPVGPQGAPGAPGFREPNFFDRLGAFANAPSMFGGIAAAMGGRDPNQLEAMNATYQGLIARGVNPDLARAAVLNPQFGAQVMGKMFPDYSEIGTNFAGQPVRGWVNPLDQSVKEASVTGPNGQASSASQIFNPSALVKLAQSGLPKEQIFQQLQQTPDGAMLASDVKAYLEGREMVGVRSPQQSMLTKMFARVLDPNADDSLYEQRKGMRKNFQNDGKDGMQIEQANSVISHAGEYMAAAKAMQNYHSGFGSQIANSILGKYRELAQDSRVNKLDVMKDILTKEVEKFYASSGSSGSAKEREEMSSKINSINSPEQMAAVGSQLVQAMTGKMNEMERKWHATMGPQAMPYPVISPASQATINDIQQWGRNPSGEPGRQAPPAGALMMHNLIADEMRRRGLQP